MVLFLLCFPLSYFFLEIYISIQYKFDFASDGSLRFKAANGNGCLDFPSPRDAREEGWWEIGRKPRILAGTVCVVKMIDRQISDKL